MDAGRARVVLQYNCIVVVVMVYIIKFMYAAGDNKLAALAGGRGTGKLDVIK